MDRLSAEHRTVISLFAVDGLSHREIADVLGVPEGTVWSRLAAARRKLHEALGAADSHDAPKRLLRLSGSGCGDGPR
jgi:RNA polymerase sigma-70 factor (ECF subfamily)